MNTAKHDVENILKQLPDDCSLADIQYHIYIAETVKHRLELAENPQHKTFTQEEVKGQLRKWIIE